MRPDNDFFVVPDDGPTASEVDDALRSVRAAFQRRRRRRGATIAVSAAALAGVGWTFAANGGSGSEVTASGESDRATSQTAEEPTTTSAPSSSADADGESSTAVPTDQLSVVPTAVAPGQPTLVTVALPDGSPHMGFGLEVRVALVDGAAPLWGAMCPAGSTDCEPTPLSDSRPTIPYVLLNGDPETGEGPAAVFNTGSLPAGVYEVSIVSSDGESVIGTLEVAS